MQKYIYVTDIDNDGRFYAFMDFILKGKRLSDKFFIDLKADFLQNMGIQEQIQNLDLEQFALKSDLPNLELYALKSDLQVVDLEPYALKSDIQSQNVDLSEYALKSELPNFSDFALKTDLQTCDLSPYALKSELPNLANYALKSEIPSVDLEPYALKSEIVNYDDSEIQSRLTVLEAKTDNDTIYDDTELKSRVTALENRTDNDTIYDDSDLKSQISALEAQITTLKSVIHNYKELGANIEKEIGANSRVNLQFEIPNIGDYTIMCFKQITIQGITGGGEGWKNVVIQSFATTGGGTKCNISLYNMGASATTAKLNVVAFCKKQGIE